jgi:hypothetical protein
MMKKKHILLILILLIVNGLVVYNLYLAHQCALSGRTMCLTPLLFFLTILAPLAIQISSLVPDQLSHNRELIENMIAIVLLNLVVIVIYAAVLKLSIRMAQSMREAGRS